MQEYWAAGGQDSLGLMVGRLNAFELNADELRRLTEMLPVARPGTEVGGRIRLVRKTIAALAEGAHEPPELLRGAKRSRAFAGNVQAEISFHWSSNSTSLVCATLFGPVRS